MVDNIDINKIKFSIESQFHVLKHFARIDSLYNKQLQKYYTNLQIDAQLKSPGSKFHYELINNPLELLAIFSEKIINNDYRNFMNAFVLEFNPKDYPNGIGYDSLININSLSREQSNNLIRKEGINYLPNSNIKEPAYQINYILEKHYNHFNIKTIFPGKFAPPFPDKSSMSMVNYRDFKEFWDVYCIII